MARFSEPALLVLISLLDGPKHGYAISEDIAAMAGRRLGPGTLYAAIGRLELAGLVEACPDDGKRRPYRLTSAGAGTVKAEVRRLDAVAREAVRRLGEATA